MKDRIELESMTKDELVSYADHIGAEVSAHWIKDDIIREIIKTQKAAAAKPESVKHQEANKAKIQDENAVNDAIATIMRWR